MYKNPFQTGDIVVCVDRNFIYGNIPERTYPKMNQYYTVRDVVEDCIRLHEIINGPDPYYKIEPMWFYWHFIKLEQLIAEDSIQEKKDTICTTTF